MTPEAFRHRHLARVCWSNPFASDDLLIVRALLRPMPEVLQDAVAAFGLPRLEKAWQELQAQGADDPEVQRSRPHTTRILASLSRSLRHAD